MRVYMGEVINEVQTTRTRTKHGPSHMVVSMKTGTPVWIPIEDYADCRTSPLILETPPAQRAVQVAVSGQTGDEAIPNL